MPRKPTGNPTGRPPKAFDWDEIDRMLNIQCTDSEIADILQCDVHTLDRACRRDKCVSFAQYGKSKRAGGRKSLRRAQWHKAVKDMHPTMLIWLGKQMLDQSDAIKAQHNVSIDIQWALPGQDQPEQIEGQEVEVLNDPEDQPEKELIPAKKESQDGATDT